MLRCLRSCFLYRCYRSNPHAIFMQHHPPLSRPVYSIRSTSRDDSSFEDPDIQQIAHSTQPVAAEEMGKAARTSTPARVRASLEVPPEQHPLGRLGKLPTELRVMIYSELLLYSDEESEKKLYPQISATCKEIHGEAEWILRKENFKSTMLAEVCLHGKDPRTVCYNAGDVRQLRRAGSLYEVASTFTPVSNDLRRAVIVLTLNEEIAASWKQKTPDDYRLKVRFELHLLVSQILDSANIKDVRLKIRIDKDATQEQVRTLMTLLSLICLPIRQLGARVNLHMCGDVGPSAKARLKRPVSMTAQGTLGKPALCKWLEVQKELDDLMIAGMYNSRIILAFRSFCGAVPLSSASFEEQFYVKQENSLFAEAESALHRLKTESPWHEYRTKAQKISAEARLLTLGL